VPSKARLHTYWLKSTKGLAWRDRQGLPRPWPRLTGDASLPGEFARPWMVWPNDEKGEDREKKEEELAMPRVASCASD
jgi:hypothetical protein